MYPWYDIESTKSKSFTIEIGSVYRKMFHMHVCLSMTIFLGIHTTYIDQNVLLVRNLIIVFTICRELSCYE